jgi:hypothetical protein
MQAASLRNSRIGILRYGSADMQSAVSQARWLAHRQRVRRDELLDQDLASYGHSLRTFHPPPEIELKVAHDFLVHEALHWAPGFHQASSLAESDLTTSGCAPARSLPSCTSLVMR